MDIKILDSHLRTFLKTDATPEQFAQVMSLTSVSIERIHPVGKDFLYDVEITTNRPDMASAVGLAREAGAILPTFDIEATFLPPKLKPIAGNTTLPFEIKNHDELVYRTLGVVMEVTIGESDKEIKRVLEAEGIRSLNNVIDVTNYVMRTIGHPTHVMDYDRIGTGKIIIRPSKKGEKITTLDNKSYTLNEGDLVADDGTGRIIDLLAIMGLENSVVTHDTKHIVFFLDNCDPYRIRKTSMNLGIRTEAAQLNEKKIDPSLAYDALLYGVELFKQYAGAKILSPVIDIYPKKPALPQIDVPYEKISQVIGIDVDIKQSSQVLEKLGFSVTAKKNSLSVISPSFRAVDVTIPEDVIEEIARTYGYHNLPSVIPPLTMVQVQSGDTPFSWEKRLKDMMKYWGFTECYTYSIVDEERIGGDKEQALRLSNPLQSDQTYMRLALTPSLLQVVSENKRFSEMKLFEVANIYKKRKNDLPDERLHFAGVIKKSSSSFFHVKGYLEQIAIDLGINSLTFDQTAKGIDVLLDKKSIGTITIHKSSLIAWEIDVATLLERATKRKSYTPLKKYPPIFEDISLLLKPETKTSDVISLIKAHDKLIVEVSLLDRYEDTRTFHIVYQSDTKNLTTEDVAPIRESLITSLRNKINVSVK